MSGERIEALSVCFAAGVAAGAACCAIFPHIWLPCSLSAFLLFTLMIHAVRLRRADVRLILALYLSCGAFCYLTSHAGSAWSTGTIDPLTRAAASSAERLKDMIAGIPYDDPATGGIVTALLTGDRSGISRETASIFRESGASHILALSGMHLGIIYMLLVWIMVPLGNSPAMRKVRCCMVLAVTFFYSLATGMSPSITRAFLFVTINETAVLCGRRTQPAKVFCAALLIQLALDPEVIGSIGFQLSYLAMCGIVLVFPTLEGWFPHDKGLKGLERFDPARRIWQASALGISCQLFTAPLVWLRFHTFPKYFLMTNLLAMPVTTVVMVLSIATAALTAAGACPALLIEADEKAVRTLIWILTVISGM